MKCQFCKDEIAEYDVPRKAHITIAKDKNDHVHTHGDFLKKEDCAEMLNTAMDELGVARKGDAKDLPKEIVFHNRQRIGDILMFTCAIRDFAKAYPDIRINVSSTAKHIWDHNPYIDRNLKQTDENVIKIGPGTGTNQSNRIDWHFANSYRISMEEKLGIHIPQGESRPDIYISDEEWNAGRIMKDPYWIICVSGEKGWGCKMYPFKKWQKFIDQNPDIKFVQIGARGEDIPVLQGDNVTNYIGCTQDKNTGIRELYKLFLNAEGSIGLVSFHMHLSAALYKPCIVVAGAREPVHFTRYQGHRYLNTEGCLPCASTTACWKCALEGCVSLKGPEKNIPECVDLIEPEDITRELNLYYRGGRLKKGVPSEKPKEFKRIVHAPAIMDSATDEIDQETIDEHLHSGMDLNYGGITAKDWDVIKKQIKKHNVKTILEFGCGVSTVLMSKYAHVTSYECDQRWIDKVNSVYPEGHKIIFIEKGYKNIPGSDMFDMVFVDGPASGGNEGLEREHSIRIASGRANKVLIVHDGNRAGEKKWQEKFVKDKFTGPELGGNRCSTWVRGVPESEKSKKIDSSPAKAPAMAISEPLGKNNIGAQHIKIVSTARGWGGCARSITTIMKKLLDLGHKVEFIPFRNEIGSREFRECISNELQGLLISGDYASISQECDVLFVYADDFVWEFPKLDHIFRNIDAKRKIMMLNYRRGKVGELPWTKGWDKYMFLNRDQEIDLKMCIPAAKTKVLAPCTDLERFFKVQPNYNTNLRIVRHSSQGDTKFPKDIEESIRKILRGNTAQNRTMVGMLPGPSFVPELDYGSFYKVKRTADPQVIADFLAGGNLFWYSLPEGYMDMGPRVILEAMAAGLPVIADNWGGAKDRVTPGTGWLCESKQEMIEIIKKVTPEELQARGKAARERARKEFVPDKWIEEILT